MNPPIQVSMSLIEASPADSDKALLELIKEARQHVCDLSAGRKRWRMCVPPERTDSDMLLCNALDSSTRRIITAQSTWIACSERMPDDGDDCWVLAIGPGWCRPRLVNWCRQGEHHWRDEEDDRCHFVADPTHWHALPAPPVLSFGEKP